MNRPIKKSEEQRRRIAQRAGYRLSEWTESAGFSRQKFYTLKSPPRSVKIDRMRVITESPSDWLARIGNDAR
jgi:hypothetical protein